MPTFVRTSIGFYLLAMAVGLALRFWFVFPFGGFVFQHALHAHSHTLYFGWCALGILALAFRRVGATGRWPTRLLGVVAALSACTFVSFLHGGYSAPSIALSALSLPIWGIAVGTFWKHARGKQGIDLAFLRTGVVYLAVASSGAVIRTVLIALHASAFAKSLAVFGFLHNFAWFFVFSVIGLLVSQAKALGVRFDERLLRWQLRLAAPLAWLTFPLGVAGGDQGALGIAARIAAVLLLVPAGLGAAALWKASSQASAGPRGAFRWLALWLVFEALLSATGGFGVAGLAVQSRHLAILYLHVLLVGVVSLGLMLAHLTSLGAPVRAGAWLHNAGLSVMAAGLGLAGLPVFGWSLPASLPRIGLFLAAAGGAIVYAAGLTWAVGALGMRPVAGSRLRPAGPEYPVG